MNQTCACGHPWEMHEPEIPGCCECRCRDLHPVSASGSAPTEHDTTEIAGLLAAHERTWDSARNEEACTCRAWFANIINPDEAHAAHATHLADVLVPLIAARVRTAQADAWDEGHRFTGYEPARGENPYRADRLHDTATNNRGNQ